MEIKKEIILTATSKTEEGKLICAYEGRINTSDPESVRYVPAIADQTLYKCNREQVRKEQAEFEDTLYAEQEKMVKEMEDAQ